MSKKDFSGGLSTVLGEDKAPETTKGETPKRETIKTSQKGCKPGEIRATFIVKESQLEVIKALAWYERKTIKQVLNEALQGHIKRNKKILLEDEVISLYKKKIQQKAG